MEPKGQVKSSAGAERFAVIAGNGRFPFFVVEAAREQGIHPLVVAIKEEASPELSRKAESVRWLGLSEVAQCLELLGSERITKVVLAGQVKHAQIFGGVRGDSLAAEALNAMDRKNTDALIGAFVEMIELRGIEVVDSTFFLKPLIAAPGAIAARRPDEKEMADIAYGREIAKQIAALDVGQTAVIADHACVAVEAMEGTDLTIERAGTLCNGKPLVVVKVSKPSQDMRFDVPVAGVKTIQVMKRANARVLALDAGKTLLFDRERMIAEADAAGIAIWGMEA